MKDTWYVEQLEFSYIDGGNVQPLWENSVAIYYHMTQQSYPVLFAQVK